MTSSVAAALTDTGSFRQGAGEGHGLAGVNGDDGSAQEVVQLTQQQQPLLNPLYLAHQASFARDEQLNVFVGSGGMPGGMFYE